MEEEDIVIRYETIFDLLRREKTRSELQELPPNFSLKVIDYINETNDLINGNGEKELNYIEKQRFVRELDNVKKLLNDLHEKRERKIIDMTLLKLKTSNLPPDASHLTPEEQDLFTKLEDLFKETRKTVLDDIYSSTTKVNFKGPGIRAKRTVVESTPKPEAPASAEPEAATNPAEKRKVEFTKPMEKFIGPNLEHYGPYNPGDTAELPGVIIEILKKKDAVKVL